MTNKELAAQCLIEAAGLLNEGAARDQRKIEAMKMKQMKNDAKFRAFIKGTLPIDEAKKVYNEIKADLEKIEDEIEKIPPETVGEALWACFVRSGFTLTGFTKYFIVGCITGFATNALNSIVAAAGLIKTLGDVFIMNTIGNAITTSAGIATFNSLRKTKDGGKNWNKAYAEDLLNRMQKKLNKAYVKHYARYMSTNEAAELLIETSYYMDDDED